MSDRPPFDPRKIRPSAPRTPRGDATNPVSVREVNELVSGAIARHLPATLHVLGEIGDLSRPSSGHVYFTLKDNASELRCVMWRSAAAAVKFQLKPGMEVVATGGVEVYTPRGAYQLIVRRIEPRGVGALELAFRQLRDRLEREGLFDPLRKRELPRIPRTIAIVTSPAGAALQDILKTLARRFPAVEVLLFPCRVQGEGAAAEVAGAIQLLNRWSETNAAIDVAIVGRGGGSLEDLWAFNEEIVARAIFASRVPIVSAVGHEVDITISDLVADVRAATPTAAAELVTPRLSDLIEQLERASARTSRAARHTLDHAAAALRECLARGPLARPAAPIRDGSQQIDELTQRLQLATTLRFRALRERLNHADLALLRVGTGGMTRIAQRIRERIEALHRAWSAHQRRAEQHLRAAAARLARAAPAARVGRYDERLQQLRGRAARAAAAALLRCRAELESRCDAATARDPHRILRRGYSLTRDARTGRLLRATAEIRAGQRILTELADGTFRSTADDPRQPGLFD